MKTYTDPAADRSAQTQAAAVSLPPAAWAAAAQLLGRTRRATLVCHVQPDGDALGGMLALARVLKQRGVEVTCTFGDEHWRIPPSYTWLPGIELIVPPAVIDPTPELLVVLDTGSRDRDDNAYAGVYLGDVVFKH